MNGEMHLWTKDCPTANNRRPSSGESEWDFSCPLEDGRTLHLHMGRESRDNFRGFILHEELDDYADREAKS